MLTNLKTQKRTHFKHQEESKLAPRFYLPNDHSKFKKKRERKREIERENEGEFLGY